MTSTHAPAGLDATVDYALAPGVAVIPRNATTVQIGTEASRRFLLTDAPRCAPAVFAGLDGSIPLADAVSRAGGRLPEWLPVLAQLADVGLLVPAPGHPGPAPRLRAERLALIEQYGVARADRLLAARSDAVVSVEGAGPLAALASDLLAAAGVGHVHHPRGTAAALMATAMATARTTTRATATRATATTTATTTATKTPVASRNVTSDASSSLASRPAVASAVEGAPGRTPPYWSAAHRSAAVSPFPPAPQTRPNAVLLANVGGPDPGRAAELVAAVVPHLAAAAGPARVVIGPLVLPGRSACLNCVDRHRSDADPGWPHVAAAARTHPVDAAPRALHAAAVLAVEQLLRLIDGLRRPESVDATIELRAGSLYPRRRPWPRHPDCRCRWVAHR